MRTAVLALVVVLASCPGCFSDGKYWWMGSGAAFGDGADNNKNNYQQVDNGNNFQGRYRSYNLKLIFLIIEEIQIFY